MALARMDSLPKPYLPLVPWAAAVAFLSVALAGAHFLMVVPAQARLAALEADLAAARSALARRLEAKQARKDFIHVLTVLPGQRDFARLPLAISDVAKRDGVKLPSLSYSLEKQDDGFATKAVIQGVVSGQYEDLRRFIYHMEASEELLLFVEDLSVGRSSDLKGEQKGKRITVNIRLATYIREETPRSHALRASVE